MHITLKFEGMEMTLSDDKALEIVVQIGQLLSHKKKHLPDTLPQRRRNYRAPINLATKRGKPTLSAPVYEEFFKLPKGSVIKIEDWVLRYGNSPVRGAFRVLKRRKKARILQRGQWIVI